MGCEKGGTGGIEEGVLALKREEGVSKGGGGVGLSCEMKRGH